MSDVWTRPSRLGGQKEGASRAFQVRGCRRRFSRLPSSILVVALEIAPETGYALRRTMMTSKKFAWWLALFLVACGGAEEQDGETEQVTQALPKNGSGSYSCTVEQCNGNLNPFGTCTHSINGVCVECTAGSHVGTCSGPGACSETNCPPPIKARP